jgi:sulfur relay (sulfurtransferase) DsrC/TusE family protein
MVDANNYKIKIKDLALFVRNVQLSPAVRMGHVKALEKTSSKSSLSTQPITSLFGNCPKNMLSWT